MSSSACPQAHYGVQAVATRACYLLCRLIKALRSELQAHLAEVLRGLQPHLARIITTPPPQSLSATKAAIGTLGWLTPQQEGAGHGCTVSRC